MQKMTVRDINIKGKKVIIRVDFNVPLDEKFNITDDRRITAALPTIQYALKEGAAKVILMSHLGRPKGAGFEAAFSLKPVAIRLEQLLKENNINYSCFYECLSEFATAIMKDKISGR